jgi:UDP-N-acetylglucosamine--dolichyl-phosphate N-acetylglucosaminephosphotransferase
MIGIEILLATIISALTTFFITPYAIKYFKLIGLLTTDVHKKNKSLVPHSAGIPVVAGIIAGLLFYIFLNIFIYKETSFLVYLFASLTSILIIMFSGFLDDLNSRQVKIAGYIEGKQGLKAWQKPLLTLPAAFPLMAIMAGDTTMNLPFIGTIDFGILYPLVIVPIGVIGAANMVNLLGGYNFLEAGMGLVYTFSLGIYAYLHGSLIASVIFLTTFGALLGLFKYNFYPAKILSGDSLSYTLGAVVAVGSIVGNMEKAAVITMIPFIIQGILKFYSRLKLGRFASDLGILQKNGTIKPKYGKQIYSWIHLITNLGNLNEKQIVIVMMLIQAFFSLIPFLNIL